MRLDFSVIIVIKNLVQKDYSKITLEPTPGRSFFVMNVLEHSLTKKIKRCKWCLGIEPPRYLSKVIRPLGKDQYPFQQQKLFNQISNQLFSQSSQYASQSLSTTPVVFQFTHVTLLECVARISSPNKISSIEMPFLNLNT